MSCPNNANKCHEAMQAAGEPETVAAWAGNGQGAAHCPRCGGFLEADTGACNQCGGAGAGNMMFASIQQSAAMGACPECGGPLRVAAGEQDWCPECMDMVKATVKAKTFDEAVRIMRSGYIFAAPNTLRLADKKGRTVAHEMAKRGHIFTDPDIIRLANNSGWAVAHEMANRGHIFADPDIIRLATNSGWTVAHSMATRGHAFTDPDILKMADNSGWTVAHNMGGYVFTDPAILKLADNSGWTVAHQMASRGHKFDNPEILALADNKAETVGSIVAKKWGHDTAVQPQCPKTEAETATIAARNEARFRGQFGCDAGRVAP